MRIAYFLADHGVPVFGNKGASIHVRALAKALCALGHDVTILCTKRGADVAPAPFRVIKVDNTPAPPPTPNDDDPLAQRRLKETRYLADAERMLRTFAREHERQPFDAIYERYSLWSAAAVRASRQFGLPAIIEVNAPLLSEQRAYRELARDTDAERIEREVFSQAGAIVTVSTAVANYVINHGADPKRVQVMPNGVDHTLFHSDLTPKQLPETDGRFVVAFSGTLKAWHGVDILLEGFRELNRRLAGMHLLVIGDGPMREWMQGFVRGAQLDGHVSFTGWRPHEEVAALLAGADVAVAPYPPLEDFYFSPLKLFEYMALGIPTVASDIGQIRDVIEHGADGLLIPPGNALALADVLEALALDKTLRHRIGQTAARTGRNFSWHSNAEKVIATIEALATQQATTARGTP